MPINSDNTIENEIFWINFANELSIIRENERKRLPYNFNLIDELHANEDANTRILLKLLGYCISGEYVFLKSFISMMCSNNPGTVFPLSEVRKPQISFNGEHIDGLIEEYSRQYAIIIENKINWAVDQKDQLERYFKTVKNHGVSESNIYVIYLTLDGSKKVSSVSISNWLKQYLANDSRFIEMNYRDDILPWLKHDILPEIKIKEHLIESGIRQYIDYLEGRLNIRKSEEPVKKAMNKAITEKLLQGKSIREQWKILNDSINQVEKLQIDLHNASNDIAGSVIDNWDGITKAHYDDTNNALRNGYYQIFLNGINQNIHFEWCPISEKDLFEENAYRMVLHVEDDNGKVNMSRLARIDELSIKAKEYAYVVSFDEGKGVDAIFKDYITPGNKPFADLNEYDRHTFLEKCYREVDEFKKIIEDTFHKFDGENIIIEDLCKSMHDCTGYTWNKWPDNANGWDIVTSFNKNTHEIGIEGIFAVNPKNEIVFRSKITVWEASNWDIYKKQLQERYPHQYVEVTGKRVNLQLPEISIGNGLEYWNNKKDSVITRLKETFEYMNQLTAEYRK